MSFLLPTVEGNQTMTLVQLCAAYPRYKELYMLYLRHVEIRNIELDIVLKNGTTKAKRMRVMKILLERNRIIYSLLDEMKPYKEGRH